MDLMGIEIAKLHLINLIHGDLTTSNIMVRRKRNPSTEAASAPMKTGIVELPAELVRRLGFASS